MIREQTHHHLPIPSNYDQLHQPQVFEQAKVKIRKRITNEYLEAFFKEGQYNSCKAIDELLGSIESSRDELLASKLLQLYQFHYTTLDKPWEHVNFLYGLGLIYMHFNAYDWAVKSFRDAIYVQPSFSRSRDVHTRLGLIFKATARYNLSEKHFNLAIHDLRTDSGTTTRSELRFQLAHLYEIQGKYKQAVEIYEKLLQEKDLPQRLSANINRQLGWIHYNSTPDFDEISNDNHRRIEAALHHFNTSNEAELNSSTSYYIGRCLTDIGKFQDAFASYRSVIDKDESTADTWCSIGVLHHRQNQPWDALQAYIRSVQYDKNHVTAWTNLGILYESHNQFKDALKCHQHVVRLMTSEVDKSLNARINYIQRHIKDIEVSTTSNSCIKKVSHDSDKLLGLEDLWNLKSKNNQDNGSPATGKSINDSHLKPVISSEEVVVLSNHLDEYHTGSEYFNQQKDFCFGQAITNGVSKDSGISSDSSSYTEFALVPSRSTDISASNYISAEQIVEACKGSSHRSMKLDINLLSDADEPPQLSPRSPPYPAQSSDKMFPSPPSIFLESKKELILKRLQDLRQSHPISIVRNIATVLKLDLGLFSTKTLLETNPNQQIDIVSHLLNMPENTPSTVSEEDINVSWTCERSRSSSTVSMYAAYQVNSFRQSLQTEKDNRMKLNPTKESETDSNESYAVTAGKKSSIASIDSDQQANRPCLKKFKTKDPQQLTKYVKSAEFIDLSDEKRWRPQLNELNKLPHFIKCVSASNMLTHIGAPLPGVNTIFMSMHVPGCRVIGNRAPNNFCSVTINTGPGDYEWCAISGDYEKILTKLCNQSGFEIESRNWWPRLNDLQRYNVPIYRFSQRPGDLVWVNSGTFYWIHCTGWTNSIQWKIGSICARQYKLSSQSFEIDNTMFRKSDVCP